MDPEDALIDRDFYIDAMGRIAMIEEWDTTHPHCPFVFFKKSPFERLPADEQPNPYIQHTTMTRHAFEATFGPSEWIPRLN